MSDAHRVDRGYDDLVGKLRSLGADVTRSLRRRRRPRLRVVGSSPG